jgi:hypothetical protein
MPRNPYQAALAALVFASKQSRRDRQRNGVARG